MTQPITVFVSALPPKLREWAAEFESFEESWAACERPDWLVAMAICGGVARTQLVAVTCDCIERAQLGRDMPEAWQLAKGWSRGQVDARTVWAAGFRASTAARELDDEAERQVQEAAAAAAFACDEEADDGYYASRSHAAKAISLATYELSTDRRIDLVAHIRRRVDAVSVCRGLENLVDRQTTPPPERTDHLLEAGAVTPRTLHRLRS